jgi:hypothetical protein
MLSYNVGLPASTSVIQQEFPLFPGTASSGILQERSINRQYDYTRHQPGYSSNRYKPESVPLSSTQTDAQYFIQELHRINQGCTRLIPEPELEVRARKMFKHFMTFERYENYRKSHDKNTEDAIKVTSKEGKDAPEMRWPDYMELAFFKGWYHDAC